MSLFYLYIIVEKELYKKMKTYSIRIFPTKEQIEQLQELSSIRNDIWNNLVDIQQIEYKNNKKILSRFDLMSILPKQKKIHINWLKLNSKACQTICCELFQSYQSFFGLIKKDKTARPPNKKEITNNFHTISFNQSGWSFKRNLLFINKIPFLYKTHLENITNMNIKEIRIKHINKKWLVDLVVDDSIEYKSNLNIETKTLAIDLGLKKLGTGIDNYGNTIILKNRTRKINKYFSKQINNIKSKLSKKKKYSKKYNKLNIVKRKLYSKKNSQIKQTLHIQSKKLVNMNYNTIVVGDLSVKKLMTKDCNKHKGIRKSFSESNIDMFLTFLAYKCQKNYCNLTKINEQWTTQTNCLTGKLFENHIDLSQRSVNIINDIVIDRDLNSAINIMKRFNNNHLASLNKPLEISQRVLLDIISREITII
ncbi:RNA-guided endonuclease TnpB family protein [Candidatus Dojkabacteria bacterium]|jgi:putative transposase|nr:RNA-guided endonuclease TnpB family protein [Candidatus Dojkabacteria bacterium]